MGEDRPHITVCICTFRRATLLMRLLQELGSQETAGLFTYSVVVSDNDAVQSAKELVLRFAKSSHVKVVYCAQPEQNIALARNTALANAVGEYIAFIDDDEYPARDWLLTLLRACNKYGVEGVLGPVKPHFEQSPPEWVKTGNFFERPSHETGFIIGWTEGRTGNLLFKRRILDGIREVFRRQFGSGGEDRDFFRRMIGSGSVFVWCSEAVAYEIVPPIRWKRSFMLRRALLRGKMALNHDSGIREILKSLIAVTGYTLALPLSVVMGHHLLMKCLIRTCDHAGKLLAFVGLNPIREKYVVE
jgi:succinoglycan biosynthesis protein ExoM